MLLNVLDGNGNAQTICVTGQVTPTDRSGNLAAGVAVIDANENRSGFIFFNSATHVMNINDDGTGTAPNAFVVQPGAYWPPYPGYPVGTGAIQISGTGTDPFVAREW